MTQLLDSEELQKSNRYFSGNVAKQSDAGETLTLEREGDGAWRVVGYFIK